MKHKKIQYDFIFIKLYKILAKLLSLLRWGVGGGWFPDLMSKRFTLTQGFLYPYALCLTSSLEVIMERNFFSLAIFQLLRQTIWFSHPACTSSETTLECSHPPAEGGDGVASSRTQPLTIGLPAPCPHNPFYDF